MLQTLFVTLEQLLDVCADHFDTSDFRALRRSLVQQTGFNKADMNRALDACGGAISEALNQLIKLTDNVEFKRIRGAFREGMSHAHSVNGADGRSSAWTEERRAEAKARWAARRAANDPGDWSCWTWSDTDPVRVGDMGAVAAHAGISLQSVKKRVSLFAKLGFYVPGKPGICRVYARNADDYRAVLHFNIDTPERQGEPRPMHARQRA